jgi:transketolase
VGIDRFGLSAPGPEVMREFGFTPEHVAKVAAGLRLDATRRPSA